jgi:O-acetyl-ADP-ribose deacetylase
MRVLIGGAALELVQGDITQQDTEAIVNAANSGLAGGGGVDGAIHRAGGPSIMDECRKIERCPTGEARITRGGNLQARHVIHAVGPIYNNGKSGEAQLLSSAYRSSLQLAQDYHLSSVAFPSLSTGAYRYPVRDAAKIALQTVVTFLTCEEHQIELVRFVLFDEKTLRIFEEELKALINE